VKPPVPYFGSKGTLAPWIVSLLPEHEHYVEPFCGSLAVLLAKHPSRLETVNDLDGELMTFWRILRDRPDDLVRVCALTPHSRAELEAAWESASDDLEVARRVWVRLTQGRSPRLNRTGWRHQLDPSGGTLAVPGYLNGYRDRLLPAAQRLADVSLECLPALDLIAKYGRSPLNLLYVDPPYLASTRSQGYRHELKSDDEHRELAIALESCRATVVLSGYASPLYAELYDGWHRYEIATTTANGKGDTGRTEVLWSNRALGGQAGLFEDVVA
jgi:DNA adenine methylase